MFIGFIYMVTNTINGKVYVGKTTKPFDARWKQHLKLSKSRFGKYLHNAIVKHEAEAFTFEIVDMACTAEALNEKERERIRRESAADPKFGYNLTLGGEGAGAHNEATRQRMSEAAKAALANPEARLRLSEQAKASWAVPEERQRRSEKMKTVLTSPEGRKRQCEAAKAARETPEYKQKHLEAMARPEVRERISEQAKAAWARPDTRRRVTEAATALWADPAFRARVLEAQRLARQRKAELVSAS
jgi:group I intron endonuclease